MQRLTGLRRQQARLPFDYLDPETGWKANRETEGMWGRWYMLYVDVGQVVYALCRVWGRWYTPYVGCGTGGKCASLWLGIFCSPTLL